MEAVYRAVMRLGGTMPYAQASLLLFPVVFTIAVVRTAQLDAPPQQLIPVLAMLVTLALGIFVAPVVEAAFARASERAADRYTTHRGAGADLAAAALHWINPCRPAGLLGWLHHRHPSTTSRVARLTAPRSGSAGDISPLPGDLKTARRGRFSLSNGVDSRRQSGVQQAAVGRTGKPRALDAVLVEPADRRRPAGCT